MIEPQTILQVFLAADAGLSALTGSRIYAGRDVPPPGYAPADGAAVVFRVRGGYHDYDDALLVPSVQFKCYAAGEVAAYACYRALVDALHNGYSASILYAEEETIGQSLEETGTEWRFVLSYFSVLIRQ